MSDPSEPLPCIELAEEDYLVLLSLLRRKKPLTSSACFHAQQCVEKYLKAILVSTKYSFPKTHDLRLLSNLCSKAGVFVEIDPDQLDQLTAYAIHTRYPGDYPTFEEAKQALSITKLVRKFARQWFNLK